MCRLVNVFDRYLYPEFKDNWDNGLVRNTVIGYIGPNSKLLDLGAGAGIVQQLNFKGLASCVCGVDIDTRVLENPHLDEAKVGSAECIPYEDNSFDLVILNNVLEHLSEPQKVFKEVHRVLKRDGVFIVKTPNCYHYVTVLARLTPHWFHIIYNRIRGCSEEDTFPTFYRANNRRKIAYLGESADFKLENIESIEGRPEYLRINCLFYLWGALYEKVVNASDVLCHFRVLILACFRKK